MDNGKHLLEPKIKITSDLEDLDIDISTNFNFKQFKQPEKPIKSKNIILF